MRASENAPCIYEHNMITINEIFLDFKPPSNFHLQLTPPALELFSLFKHSLFFSLIFIRFAFGFLIVLCVALIPKAKHMMISIYFPSNSCRHHDERAEKQKRESTAKYIRARGMRGFFYICTFLSSVCCMCLCRRRRRRRRLKGKSSSVGSFFSLSFFPSCWNFHIFSPCSRKLYITHQPSKSTIQLQSIHKKYNNIFCCCFLHVSFYSFKWLWGE